MSNNKATSLGNATDYVGTSGASKILGRSPKSVHRYIETGKLPIAGKLDNGNNNDAVIILRTAVETLAAELETQAQTDRRFRR